MPPTYGPPFAAYQAEIFLRGMGGEVPGHPVAWAALAAEAERVADAQGWGYLAGGAGTEDTMRANEAAFRRWRIVPRMLRDVSARDLSRTVLGTECPAPVGLAPVGVQTIVHADGERASARAAAEVGLPMTVSTMSTATMEEIAAAGDGPKWFQLYWPTDRELAASFLDRAEAAGYRAVIVTLDTFLPGWKPRDLQRGWQPFLQGVGITNYLADPVFRARLDKPPEEDPQAVVGEFVGVFTNPRLTWEDLEFLRSRTTLPIALKGILHPEDARAAREHGMDAVVVSNHGGRQVDGAIASLDALPAIVDAVGDDLDVLLDSGVRSGADVVKALALGADAVLLGRPYIWGLAVGGEAGVLAVLRALLAELDLTIGLSGHTGPDQLTPAVLVREGAS
ncbi:MAG TPA: alpha-hydroxy-acid oxidizing protein [Solirubrobacteraceae bacterium]|nr:alpha-hydroxy-acid oxidizing protein [Solirubrobacteraceae bacterium]